MIAAALAQPVWTVPIAALLAAAALWYFIRLGEEDVPPSRRRVRRLSLAVVLTALPLIVWVLSFVNPEQQPGMFIMLWSIVFVLIVTLVALALLDMMNNLRLHHETVRADLHDAAVELAEAIRKRRGQQQEPESNETADEHNAA